MGTKIIWVRGTDGFVQSYFSCQGIMSGNRRLYAGVSVRFYDSIGTRLLRILSADNYEPNLSIVRVFRERSDVHIVEAGHFGLCGNGERVCGFR